ncbi:Corytuberine synthase [Linum perenne]
MDPSTYNAFQNLLHHPFFIIFIIFFFPLLLLHSTTKPKKLHLPPGPKPWPILGNIPQLLKSKSPHITFSQFAQSHGPLISLKLGSQIMIIASSPMSASQILRTHDCIFSARYLSKSNPFELNVFDQAAIVWAPTCTDGWKSLRSLCQTELFSPKMIEAQSVVREKKVGEMVDYLLERQGEMVNIGEIVFTTVFNSLCKVFFSKDLLGFEDGLKSHVREMMEVGVTPNVADFYPFLEWFDPQGMKKKMLDSFQTMFALWDCYVKERREIRRLELVINGGDFPKEDFLDVFLANGFDDHKINWLFLQELLTAGTDTTTTTIEWAMAELLMNKEALTRVREELSREIGTTTTITESNTSQLPFLNACIKETLRLHPPAPFLIPHRAQETCNVMNYTIPKNSQIIINVWAISRDPSVWVDPLSFKPERFLDGSTRADFKGRDFEFLPFGSGRRMCPGLPVAVRQLPLILASLVRGFDWSLPVGQDLDMREKFGLTLHKDQPLVLVVDKQRT